MSYTIPKTLLGSDSSGKLSFSTDGSKYALNSGEGFIGYKSNLGTYYQNAFVVDTNSTTPVVFSTNSTPAFSVSANASLVLFGNVLKGALNVGDTNVPDFGNSYVPLGDAYFTSLIIGPGQKGGTLARTVSHELELRAGTSAQAFQIYNTYTDASNYERLEIKWDANVATIEPTAAGTGTKRSLQIGHISTNDYIDISGAGHSFYVNGTKVMDVSSSYITVAPTQTFRPASDSVTNLGRDATRWANTYTDNITIGDGVDAITATSKQLKVDVDVSRLIADPDGPGISSFVQLTGDSQWANNTYGHSFSTELASNSQGPSNQVTGLHNTLIFRDSGHTGTSFWGATNNVTAMAPVNFGGRTVHALNNRFSNSHFISVNSGTEIAGMNCSQSWTYDPTVTGSPTLAGAVFNLTTGRLESAGYTHLRVNDASSPTSGSAGPQFLYGLYIEEQTQAQNAEDNFTILTEGGRSSIKELDTDVFRIYNTFTDFSNYEALEMKFDTNVATIATTSAGTGTGRLLKIQGEANVEIFSGIARLMRFTYSEASFHRTRLRPELDGQSDLGSSTKRWGDTYTDTITIGDGVDAVLTADAADTLALRNSTNAQQFNVYNTYTDASNYERLEVKWDSNVAMIEATSDGTGSNRVVAMGNGVGNSVAEFSTAGIRSAAVKPKADSVFELGGTSLRWLNTYTDKITIGDGTDAILNGDGTGKIYMGNDSSQFTQFAVRGEDDGAGNYNQLEMRMASNGACGLYSTGYGTQTPSGLSIFHNGTKTFEFTSTQLYIHKPFRPTSAGSESLGTTSVPFGDLYISSSSKIYFNNSQLLGAVGGSGIILEQRNGTTEQRYYLYNTYTDGNNYERLEMKWDANDAIIEPKFAGTGSSRSLYLRSGGSYVQVKNDRVRLARNTTDGIIIETATIRPYSADDMKLGNSNNRWTSTITDGLVTNVETFTATDTLDDQNQVCLCNATTGNITLNLPVASSTPSGTQYQIKKIDSSSNTVIITPNSGGGDLIDGSTTYTLSNQWEGVIIVCDGGDWYVTGGVTNSGGGGGGGGGLGGGD